MNFKTPSKMNDTQAHECILHKLPKLYRSETGKKFINHIVNSFSPGNTLLVLTNDSDTVLTDCITNRILKPVFDHKPSKDEVQSLKSYVTFDCAVKSKISDKLLGKTEHEYLIEWVKSEIAAGNEEIKKIFEYNSKRLAKSKKSTQTQRSKNFKQNKFNKSDKNNTNKKVDYRRTISASKELSDRLSKLKDTLK